MIIKLPGIISCRAVAVYKKERRGCREQQKENHDHPDHNLAPAGSELLRYFGIQILLHYALVLISMAIAVVLNSNVFSMTIVICLCMNTMIVLYGVINHLIQKAGVENFQILKYTVTGKIALLSMSPTNKECLTAVVIAAAFGIVVTLLTAWVFRKRDI